MDYVKGNMVIERQKSFVAERHYKAYAKRLSKQNRGKAEAVKEKEVKAHDGV